MIEQVRAFAKLTVEKRELEAKLRQVNDTLGDLEADVLDYFATEGIQNIKTDIGTLYVNHEVFASLEGEPESAYRALRRAGCGWLIKQRKEVPSQTLRAYVRECLKDGGLPKRLQRWIKVTDQYKIRMRNN